MVKKLLRDINNDNGNTKIDADEIATLINGEFKTLGELIEIKNVSGKITEVLSGSIATIDAFVIMEKILILRATLTSPRATSGEIEIATLPSGVTPIGTTPLNHWWAQNPGVNPEFKSRVTIAGSLRVNVPSNLNGDIAISGVIILE